MNALKPGCSLWLAASVCAFAACTGSINTSRGGQSGQSGATGANAGRTGGGGFGAAGASGAATLAPVAARRLTASQHRNVVDDLFGPGLTWPAVEPEPAIAGFTSVGASEVGASLSTVERYAAAAEAIARGVFSDATRRASNLGRGGGAPRKARH
jgi:hypothetical protein